MELIIQLISGAVGGNLAGAAMKDRSLGMLGNSIAGLVGGGIGGKILGGLLGGGGAVATDAAAGLDIGAIVGQIASGGVGGGVVMIVVGIVKNMMAK